MVGWFPFRRTAGVVVVRVGNEGFGVEGLVEEEFGLGFGAEGALGASELRFGGGVRERARFGSKVNREVLGDGEGFSARGAAEKIARIEIADKQAKVMVRDT